MGGILKKALAGAAGAVEQWAGNMALATMRSQILSEREARLRQYQTGERLATQEFQAGQLDKRLEAQRATQESDLDLKRTSQEETARHNRAIEATAARGFDIKESAAEAKANAVKPVKYPQRQTVLDAQDLINADAELSKLRDDDRSKLAFNVAARTQKLLAENPGIDASEAMSMALEEETQNIIPGEQRSRFGIDLLARDKPPSYQDRRTADKSQWLTPVSERTPQEADTTPPPEALTGLQEGMQRRFANGQVWTVRNGQPVRVR